MLNTTITLIILLLDHWFLSFSHAYIKINRSKWNLFDPCPDFFVDSRITAQVTRMDGKSCMKGFREGESETNMHARCWTTKVWNNKLNAKRNGGGRLRCCFWDSHHFHKTKKVKTCIECMCMTTPCTSISPSVLFPSGSASAITDVAVAHIFSLW